VGNLVPGSLHGCVLVTDWYEQHTQSISFFSSCISSL